MGCIWTCKNFIFCRLLNGLGTRHTAITSSSKFNENHWFEIFLVPNLCLVTQRNPIKGPSLVQYKVVVHRSDRVGASLNILKQNILEWIFNTQEKKTNRLYSLRQISIRQALLHLHHLQMLFPFVSPTLTSLKPFPPPLRNIIQGMRHPFQPPPLMFIRL